MAVKVKFPVEEAIFDELKWTSASEELADLLNTASLFVPFHAEEPDLEFKIAEALAQRFGGKVVDYAVKADQMRGNIEGLAKHLYNTYGEPGLFTACMASSELESYPTDARARICANVHKIATGRWPAEGRGKKMIIPVEAKKTK